MKAPRELCFELLLETERSKSYSNIALDNALRRNAGLDARDKRFITALYYGTIERMLTLDAVISLYSKRPTASLSPDVRAALRMGIYQLLYMDSVPDSAAVNESVGLLKRDKKIGASGFVNAVLRSFIRDGKRLPTGRTRLERLSIEYSCPQWLIKSWTREYGEAAAASILSSSLESPPVTLRLNSCRFSREEILSCLELDGADIEEIPGFPDSYNLRSGSVEELSAYKKGMLYVQDLSSQIAALSLEALPGQTVIDVCAAPGGKSFTVAQHMKDSGRIYSYDIHKGRVGLIAEGAKRLGLKSVTAGLNDASVYSCDIPMADRVLCDVPCSGLGVIRRKPEIKYQSPEEADSLPELQYKIAATSLGYLKPGGIMIYSTCTLRRCENDNIVKRLLDEYSELEPENIPGYSSPTVTIIPEPQGKDGFFIARLRKRG